MSQTNHLWKPLDREYIADPYEMYRVLREKDPVHKSQTGEWIITRYEDAKNILRSNNFLVGNRFEWLKMGIGFLKDKSYDFNGIERAMHGFILFLNAPDHTRIRRFIHAAWDSRDVETLISKHVEFLLRNKEGVFDIVNDFSGPLPAMTISKILGLPDNDYKYLKIRGSIMIKALDLYISLGDIKKINSASIEFLSYFEQIIKEKEKNPDDGLISKLIELNKKEKELTDKELISSCILLFISGEETTVSLISTGLLNLIRSPEILKELRSDYSKIPLAIEELIRYDTPVQIVGRIAAKDVVLDGKEIRANENLTICLGSANRDERIFNHADEIDIKRNPNKHLGFGGGAHYCLGDWLARIQSRIAFESLFKNFSKIELMKPTPEWNNHLSIRCMKGLPVRLRR